MKSLIYIVLIISIYGSFLFAPTNNPANAQDNATCYFIINIQEVTILIDEGDGLFDDLMEVQMLFVTSEDEASLPERGSYQVGQNEPIVFDDPIMLVGEGERPIIYMLFIEVDQPIISLRGITEFVVGGLASTIDPTLGSIFTVLITEGISYLEELAFSDLMLSEDSVILSTDPDDLGTTTRYVTEDGHVEVVYSLELTQSCSTP